MLGLLNQLMIVGELWTAGASHAGDSFSLSLWPTRGYGGPPTHNMGLGFVEGNGENRFGWEFVDGNGENRFGWEEPDRPLVPLTSTDHDVPYPAGCR